MKTVIIIIAIALFSVSSSFAQYNKGSNNFLIGNEKINKIVPEGSISATALEQSVLSQGYFLVEPKEAERLVLQQQNAFQGEGTVLIVSEPSYLVIAEYDKFGKLWKYNKSFSADQLIEKSHKPLSMIVVGKKK